MYSSSAHTMPMAKDWIIATVGVSDEQAAHLRLLMRKAAKLLPESWHWGNEHTADLLVVNPTDFTGHMARTRAQARSTSTAIFCDVDHPEKTGLILREPLRLENVLEVLKAASASALMMNKVASDSKNFASAGRVSMAYASADSDDVESEFPGRPPAVLGLDELIKAQAQKRTDDADLKRIKLDASTTIAATGAPSARAQNRINDSSPNNRQLNTGNSNIRRLLELDSSEHALRYYLEGENAITVPSQIQLPDSPALTLDPKNGVFHASGYVSELRAYCEGMLSSQNWKILTTRELCLLREKHPARRFAELIWLESAVTGSGRLAAHLDPGGSYRIKTAVSAAPDFLAHDAIVRSMQTPARLNEIAANAGTSMDAVFSVVNAYDTIGAIEWTPRQRRHIQTLTETEKKSGLLGRIGWLLGKK